MRQLVALLGAVAIMSSVHVSASEGPTVVRPFEGRGGTGVSLAYDNGGWGGEFAQGLRLRMPLLSHWAVNLRAIALHGLEREPYRFDLGGRLELIGHTPVYLNLVRLYGGGGVQVFRPLSGVDQAETAVGGGGQFGFEFFLSRRAAFFLEVGGSSGSQGEFAAGATLAAGVQVYPF
jgi:hypothetical protein